MQQINADKLAGEWESVKTSELKGGHWVGRLETGGQTCLHFFKEKRKLRVAHSCAPSAMVDRHVNPPKILQDYMKFASPDITQR